MLLPDPYTYALEVPEGQPPAGDPIVPLFKFKVFGLVSVGKAGAEVDAKLLKEKQKQQSTTNAHSGAFKFVIVSSILFGRL